MNAVAIAGILFIIAGGLGIYQSPAPSPRASFACILAAGIVMVAARFVGV